MKFILTLLAISLAIFGNAQEFDSDLFAALNNTSLKSFWKSGKNRMTVETYRHSEKHGTVLETTTNYRKGKINPNRISFNIKYTEFFVLEDRKKSLGKYEFLADKIYKYERTDFDSRNARLYTMYHNFYYTDDLIVNQEKIRTKEYVASGSVDFDTVVYHDTVLYKVTKEGLGYRQDNLTDPGVYAVWEVEGTKLISKTNYFEGFNERTVFEYDPQGRLIKISNILTGDEGKSITTKTTLHYSMEGLLDETKFTDENGEVLERKVFKYK